MKMKYSNKGLLDNLSKNYSVRQSNKSNKILYAASGGLVGGFIVGLVMNYFQKKKIEEFVGTIKKQGIFNDQLQLENHFLKEENKDHFLVSSESESENDNDNTLTESESPLFNSNNEEIDNKT